MKQLLEKLSRQQDSHKGQNGKVLVIGGSEKYTGAPALAAQAALRSGADLVKILTSEDAKPVIQSFSENLIVDGFGESFSEEAVDRALELDEWADITVIGPGLSDFDQSAVREFAERAGKLLIDAEAIDSLVDTSENIFTPHRREAETIKEKHGSIDSFVQEKDNTVLLKGKIDRIYSEGQEFDNKTGCSGMTVGGTGDVLAGLVASFKAQGLSDMSAARLGAYVNGLAGEKALEKCGNGLVATDLLEEIPKVVLD